MIILLFSLIINFRREKRLSKIPLHVLQPQFQCVPLRHDSVVRKDVRHAQFAHSFENRRIKCS